MSPAIRQLANAIMRTLPIMPAEDPFTAVVMGCGRCLDEIELLRDVQIRS